MKRKNFVYFFIVLAGLTLIGCGGGGSSSGGGTTPDSNITLDDFEDVTPHDPNFGTSSDTLHFSGSGNCINCHSDIYDENNTDVSLVNAWQATTMANSATDPLYLAKVASEVQRNPVHKDAIEKKCSRCHMPMANVEAGFVDEDLISMSGDGFLNPTNDYYHAAKDGVSCTLCHQIENNDSLGTVDGFSGGFSIDENTQKPDRLIYGPYENPKTGPMKTSQMNVGFTPTHSNHVIDSKLCATCHNLFTPVIGTDGEFADIDDFPEQAVYTEWEYSDFNNSGQTPKSCQECHMPLAEGSVIISITGSVGSREPFRQHKFLGANTYMLQILKENREKLGVIADEDQFDNSITDTKEFLKAYADINISIPNFTNNIFEFSVKVTNHGGHKFPTSLPTRRAWIHVKVTDSKNNVVFESGKWDSNTNRIIGVDDNNDGYEPHYSTINNSNQVQVYESIMGDTDGNQTYTFMNAASYLKDNRILPKGFDKQNVPDTIKPYGNAYDDNDFVGGSDTINYSVSGLEDGEYTISATLKYQTASYGFIQDLYKDINLTEVALMKLLDEKTENHHEDNISTSQVTYSPK